MHVRDTDRSLPRVFEKIAPVSVISKRDPYCFLEEGGGGRNAKFGHRTLKFELNNGISAFTYHWLFFYPVLVLHRLEIDSPRYQVEIHWVLPWRKEGANNRSSSWHSLLARVWPEPASCPADEAKAGHPHPLHLEHAFRADLVPAPVLMADVDPDRGRRRGSRS